MKRLLFVHTALAVLCLFADVARCDQVTGDRFVDPSAAIDRYLAESWRQASIEPSARSGDAEFCRRVWLDLAGVAPPVWRLRTFLADPAPDKRDRLIDSLLESTRFANHMADRWNAFLLPAETAEQNRQNAAELQTWLRQQFLKNTPYDHLVGRFLTAGGKSDRGPAIFYTSRNLEPVKLAAATSRLFLGVQLECAQCHDHPYARWTQDDFWSFAAFFAQLRLSDSDMRGGGQAIEDRSGTEVLFPESDRVMSPRYPGASSPPEADPTDFRRRQLTIWLASRNNPYFARAAANRVWAHLFGRGIVDPVDAMDSSHPPSHPELLQFLADYLVEQRFDLRALYRVVANSDAYQRSSETRDATRPPADSFAAMNIKTLSASQYFDSLRQNVLMGGQNAGGTQMARTEFLRRMDAADADSTDFPHGVVQVLGMMNGPEMLAATAEQQSGLIASMDAPFFDDADRIEMLFLACLSRPPTDDERHQFLAYLNEETQQSAASRLSDLTWILLNTAECFVCP
ncbi:hypothetical protein Mal15_20160 [Stieleria maiorica]|uniref:DUF1553 domain-containing protein n=1 Tax=Stieleria maiorica TaxID=2795974 RepID=A0A5B9MDD8_9BACT|nr:DUF1549 and DUF1553 domain-containing protein [Stieleria maiorica]QEF97970.1 hypothetical protein Mal15_20160 [Stieleria maiorica]